MTTLLPGESSGLQAEREARKEAFLANLTGFLAEANAHGWATGAAKEKNEVTGEKTLTYERDNWRYVDTYSGYFAAPGETKVYYNGRHVWSMSYAGQGQVPTEYAEVQATFDFLKDALTHFDPALPLRGPARYTNAATADNRTHEPFYSYRFELVGTIASGVWNEIILKQQRDMGTNLLFNQVGTCGVIIDKDEDYNPVCPWDL